MMNHIDISSVLRQTLACDLYSNLVTRSTGAAVRGQIEQLLIDAGDRALTVIDFSQVSMIDLSCADEVVAKLLMRYADETRPQNAYFLFRGVTEHHSEAIESVLERHGLALAIEQDDGVHVMGVLRDVERRAWEATYRLARVGAGDVADEIACSVDEAQDALDSLLQHRLVMYVDGDYVAVGRARG